MLSFRDWMRRYKVSENFTVVRCGRAMLTDLEGIENFHALEYLDCAHNELRRIPDLRRLNRLTHLNMSYNRVEQMPGLPQSLNILDCSFNAIHEIVFDTALSQLQQLLCTSCGVETMGDLSGTRVYLLDCRNNKLKKIPKTPSTLIHSFFEGNPIEEDEEEPSDG